MSHNTLEHDEDHAHLASLGYNMEKTFKRDMTLWGNLSLGFTYLSPVVGIYTIFATSLGYAGPPMLWSLIIVGVGQLLVALVFGEVVSNYPVSGGIYPWARHLWGRKWAWMSGWIYLISLLLTVAAVALGSGGYIDAATGISLGDNGAVWWGIILALVAGVINLGGTKVVSTFALIGFTAELLGALVVGVWLLSFARHNDLSVLFNSFGAGSGSNYFTAFAAGGLLGIFQYYGFEACGDVAEEVKNPGRVIPRAMRMTIYIGGAAATFVCFALIMAVPNIGDIVSGKDTNDPVIAALSSGFGQVGFRIVLAVVIISFLSCVMSLQAAASRLGFSMGREHMLPGSRALKIFSQRLHVPVVTLLIAVAFPVLVMLVSLTAGNAVTIAVSFASCGIYIGFQMIVFAALRARIKGWKPRGAFKLGRWAYVVNIGALVWGIMGIIDVAWPRTPDDPWYLNWGVVLGALIVIGLGSLYLFIARPYLRGDAPTGDAISGGLTISEAKQVA